MVNIEILNKIFFSAIGPSCSGPEPDDWPLNDDRHAEGQLDQRPPHDRHRRLDQLALQWVRHHQGRFENHFNNRTTIRGHSNKTWHFFCTFKTPPPPPCDIFYQPLLVKLLIKFVVWHFCYPSPLKCHVLFEWPLSIFELGLGLS